MTSSTLNTYKITITQSNTRTDRYVKATSMGEAAREVREDYPRARVIATQLVK